MYLCRFDDPVDVMAALDVSDSKSHRAAYGGIQRGVVILGFRDRLAIDRCDDVALLKDAAKLTPCPVRVMFAQGRYWLVATIFNLLPGRKSPVISMRNWRLICCVLAATELVSTNAGGSATTTQWPRHRHETHQHNTTKQSRSPFLPADIRSSRFCIARLLR